MNSINQAAWEGFNQHFSLWRQPIVGLHGQGCSYEILLRCSSTDAIQPVIEAFEAAHLSEVVDDWVILQAIDYLQVSGDPCTYSINLSPLSFQEPHLARRLVEQVKAADVSPRQLKIELTEHYLLPWATKARSALLYLKGEGFEVWLDDFGVGHSLADLTDRVQPSGIKIDGSYIRRLGDPRFAKIVADLIGTAKAFDCQVTAEWIEDSETLDLLRNLGCDWGQGYWLGRPEPLLQGAAARGSCPVQG